MIKIVRDNNITTFESIETGTLFFAVYPQDGSGNTDYETIFMKISLVNDRDCDDLTNLNAVVVVGDAGTMNRFEPYERVIPIYNADFVIKN